MSKKPELKQEAEQKPEVAEPVEISSIDRARRKLERGTRDARKDVGVAKVHYDRIRQTVKDNAARLYELMGDPESEYDGYGRKKTHTPSGLVADARDALDKAITEGNRVGAAQKSLDVLVSEAKALKEWLDKRADRAVAVAETAVKKAETDLMHIGQKLYSKITAELCEIADEGMAKVFSAFYDDTEIRRHFRMTLPGFIVPEPFPLHCAGFVANSLYPDIAKLDIYSKMAQRFQYDRNRAKYIFLAKTHKWRDEAQERLNREFEGNLNRSISMKCNIFRENAGRKVSDDELAEIAEQAKAEYLETHPRPIATEKDFIDQKPVPIVTRTVGDIEKELIEDQRQRYVAAGLTENGDVKK